MQPTPTVLRWVGAAWLASMLAFLFGWVGRSVMWYVLRARATPGVNALEGVVSAVHLFAVIATLAVAMLSALSRHPRRWVSAVSTLALGWHAVLIFFRLLQVLGGQPPGFSRGVAFIANVSFVLGVPLSLVSVRPGASPHASAACAVVFVAVAASYLLLKMLGATFLAQAAYAAVPLAAAAGFFVVAKY